LGYPTAAGAFYAPHRAVDRRTPWELTDKRVRRRDGSKTPGRNYFENRRFQEVDDDSDLVTQVAAQLVSQFGAEAAAYARDQNEIAIGLDDENSAQAWLDIAVAADDLLRKPT
jgi:hypothetical protein